MSRSGIGLGFVVLLCAGLNVATAAAEADGAAIFEHWCAHCHDSKPAAPGRLKLAWTRDVDKSLLAGRRDLDAAYIRQVVRRGQAEMPSFRKTEISAAELDAVIVFLPQQP